MTTDPDSAESSGATGRIDGPRRTLLTLRVVKLALGILVSTLTLLELVGVL